MKQVIAATVLLLSLPMLTACGSTTITRYKTDRLTGDPYTEVEEKHRWRSSNLAMHYEHEKSRTVETARAAQMQIAAISEAAVRASVQIEDPTARALHGILTQMQIAMVQTTPGPSGIPAPKTMTDFWGPNLVPLINTGLQAYHIFGGKWGDNWTNASATDSPEVHITGSGNNMFFKSDGNMNPAYNIHSMGMGRSTVTTPGIGGYSTSETHTKTENRGDTSQGLSLF